MNAWLVTWDASGAAAELGDSIAGVFNARRARSRVAEYMESLYALKSYRLVELVDYARRPRSNPYRVRSVNGHLFCGHNPALHGRLVADLTVATDPETGIESLSWLEHPTDRATDGPQVAREAYPQEVRRRITGPLCHESIWDRGKGSYRPGWGPGENPELDE